MDDAGDRVDAVDDIVDMVSGCSSDVVFELHKLSETS